MIMVTRHVARVSFLHVSLLVAENIPHAESSVTLVPCAFNLIGCSRSAPYEIFLKAHYIRYIAETDIRLLSLAVFIISENFVSVNHPSVFSPERRIKP